MIDKFCSFSIKTSKSKCVFCKTFEFKDIPNTSKSFKLKESDFPWKGATSLSGSPSLDLNGNQWKWFGGPIELSQVLPKGKATFNSLYDNTCVLTCPKGTYKNKHLCLYCNENCNECSSKNSCEVCKEGKYKVKGQCLEDCPIGYSKTENNVCINMV